ncbi:MAG TPA: 50S ribosomal protein L1 [Candidatus Akkermansia intestinigallinarum]|uniref:Large ribosomal subunit protein uL1 n=1 Tax=Candidatus Akkermansia intestinigallinarum TaxID=2838431 RepID=A0A9D1VA95_9BACT|nr:50S ribosomal protein L1 [Candidatus Akkermansia intestinigallinarum]
MSTKRSKRYNEAAKLVAPGKTYAVEEAVEVMKSFPAPKFDPTVTVSFRLTVDPRKSDQMVRASVALPHGTGKNVRVIVFAQGEAAQAALEAGAEKVGLEDLIKEIQDGFLSFDSAIATPDAMAQVRKIARVLGPRGLMPNPKTGTVTEDTAKAVREVKAGRVDFKVDKNANISAPVGKLSFESDKLAENIRSLINAVVKARPSGAKGAYIASVTISSSMNPGLPLSQVEFSKQ